jgi:hypothetical protein
MTVRVLWRDPNGHEGVETFAPARQLADQLADTLARNGYDVEVVEAAA